MNFYLKIILVTYGILFISFWTYLRVRDWREDRIFWKQLKIKLEKHEDEFYKNLFAALEKDPRFMKMVDDIAKALFEQRMKEQRERDKPPLDKGKLLNRIKQWIIDLF
jgi:hypothetical protein